MAKYTYLTEVYKDGRVIVSCEYNSLKTQTDNVLSLVRDKLTKEDFPTPYVTETIDRYTKALRQKNVSKKKYYYTFHNDNGIDLQITRFGVTK